MVTGTDGFWPEEIVERVREMEVYFDKVLAAVEQDPDAVVKDASVRDMLHVLLQYYEGGQWLKDYECDEKGMLPADLKRGVLSQDGIYNLLGDPGER